MNTGRDTDMKVLFSTYPMAFHTPGGGEMQLLAYERHLPAHGVEVRRFDLWNPRFLDHDVVHFFSCMGGSIHFCAFVKKLGLPLVVTSSLWITPQTRHLYACDEIRSQMALADRIVTNSDEESDMLAKTLDVPREKFAAVLNGVEATFFEPEDPRRFLQRFAIEGPFVLCVGNVEPRKNQINLVRAMKGMPGHRLVLIGHIREPAYGEQALQEGGEQVLYLGPLDHMDPLLRSAYAAADVFALPSTLETPGLAALEAWAQGARVVVTQEGSTRSYFGDGALYVDHADVGSILQALRQASAQNRANDSAIAARRDRLAWPNVVRPLVKIYREAIDLSQRAKNQSQNQNQNRNQS